MTNHTDQQLIVTRPDGSIDTAYYMARGRRLRSRQAHDLAAQTTKAVETGIARAEKSLFRRLAGMLPNGRARRA